MKQLTGMVGRDSSTRMWSPAVSDHSTRPPALALLLLLSLYNGQPEAKELDGSKGKTITIRFVFDSSLKTSDIKYVNLYKDEKKVQEWFYNRTHKKSDITHFKYELSNKDMITVSNLTHNDSGTYFLGVIQNTGSVINSEKVHLNVNFATTEVPPVYNNTEAQQDASHPRALVHIYIICITIFSSLVICVTLLSWLYLSHRKSTPVTGYQRAQPSNPQASEEGPGLTAVYSIEYGVLDFQNKPGDTSSRIIPDPRDSVEYSTVAFSLRDQNSPLRGK